MPAYIRVGQNRIYTPHMTVYLVTSLPKIPCINSIYMVLANPTYITPSCPCRHYNMPSPSAFCLCLAHSILHSAFVLPLFCLCLAHSAHTALWKHRARVGGLISCYVPRPFFLCLYSDKYCALGVCGVSINAAE